MVFGGIFYMHDTYYYETMSVSQSHYYPHTIDSLTKESQMVVLAEPTNVSIELLYSEYVDYYPNGTEYVYSTQSVPYQKITLKVHEYIKDTTGKFSDKIDVYDMVSGHIGYKDGVKHKFHFFDTLDHTLHESHLYMIEDFNLIPDKLFMMSFTHRYEFETLNGTTYIDSEFNKLGETSDPRYEILPYDETKQRMLLIAEDGMTPKDIEKRNQQLLPNLDG